MRLDKAVTMMGFSRSEARQAVRQGRVSVNGRIAADSSLQLRESDCVTLDGQSVDRRLHRHFMVNKPAGCLTATSDPHGKKTVLDLLPQSLHLKDLGPVGRLDQDVTGLVILTTDGELAHRLISPKRGIEKQYFAEVEGKLGKNDILAFKKGISLSDFTAKPARLEILSTSEERSVCRVFVSEGKFHQVKRMLSSLGHPVIMLKREQIAGLQLDESLDEGAYRPLTDEEIALLYGKAGMDQP